MEIRKTKNQLKMDKIKLFENFDQVQNSANLSNSLIFKALVFDNNGGFLGSLDESSTEESVEEIRKKVNESEGITIYKVSESGTDLDEGLLDWLGLTMKGKIQKAEKTLDALSRSVKNKKVVDFKVEEYNKYKKEFEEIMKAIGGDEKKADAEQKKVIEIYKGIVYMLNNNKDFVYAVDPEKGTVKQTAGYGQMANVKP